MRSEESQKVVQDKKDKQPRLIALPSLRSVQDRCIRDQEEMSHRGTTGAKFSAIAERRRIRISAFESLVSGFASPTAQKKSRKQRIPGGRRTLAASGGDWLAFLSGPHACQHSVPTARTVRGLAKRVKTFPQRLVVHPGDVNYVPIMTYDTSAESAGARNREFQQFQSLLQDRN